MSTPIPTINVPPLECGSLLPLFRQPRTPSLSGNHTVSRTPWVRAFLFGLYLEDCGAHENTEVQTKEPQAFPGGTDIPVCLFPPIQSRVGRTQISRHPNPASAHAC